MYNIELANVVVIESIIDLTVVDLNPIKNVEMFSNSPVDFDKSVDSVVEMFSYNPMHFDKPVETVVVIASVNFFVYGVA